MIPFLTEHLWVAVAIGGALSMCVGWFTLWFVQARLEQLEAELYEIPNRLWWIAGVAWVLFVVPPVAVMLWVQGALP